MLKRIIGALLYIMLDAMDGRFIEHLRDTLDGLCGAESWQWKEVRFEDVDGGRILDLITNSIPREGEEIFIWDSFEDWSGRMEVDARSYEVRAVFRQYIKGEEHIIPDIVVMVQKTFVE